MKQIFALLIVSITIAAPHTRAEPAINDLLDVSLCIAVLGWAKLMATKTEQPMAVGFYNEAERKYLSLWFKRYPNTDPKPYVLSSINWIYEEVKEEMQSDGTSIPNTMLFLAMAENCINDWPGEE